MASANLELDRFGGRVNFDVGELVTRTDLNRMGSISMSTLMHFLGVLFFDEENAVPITGFPRDTESASHCKVSSTSDLGFSVSTGWGMMFDASALGGDDYAPTSYLPIVVGSALTGTLDANSGSPRIDLVCLAPNLQADQSASRNVKDPGTGVESTSTINQRERFSAQMQIVKGTPGATPSPPSVPTGYVEVGRAVVPATSGAAVWEDTRPLIQIGHFLANQPRYSVSNYVPLGGADELQVNANSPVAMNVTVTRGRAVINGICRQYKARVFPPVTISAADGTHPRIDLVYAKEDGTIDVVTGTPAASPTVPSLPANSCALAQVLVGTSVTTIASGNITDVRDREPYDGETMVQHKSVPDSKNSVPTVKIAVDSIVDGNVAKAEINLLVTDIDGNNLEVDGACFFEATVYYLGVGSVAISTGTFGFGAGKVYQPLVHDSPVLFLFAPDTNTSAALVDPYTSDAFMGKMIFTPFDPTTPACKITLRREDNTSNLQVMVVIKPITLPGAGCVAQINFT